MQRHQDRIEFVIGLEHGEVNVRIAVAGKADKAALPRFFRCLESLNGTPGTEYLLNFFLLTNSMNLP